jgi:transposase
MTNRKRYTRDFKLEAIRLLETSDKPITDIARQLGVRRNLLYKWRDTLTEKGEASFPGSGRKSDYEQENIRLKRELEQVKEERDILKNATVDSIGRCNRYSDTALPGPVYS